MSQSLYGGIANGVFADTMQNKQMLYNIGMTAWANKTASDAADEAFARQLYLQNMAQEWTEHMSSTAHQREVADLKAAGLNPILSANGGAATIGAGTPSVNMRDTSMWNDLAKQNITQGAQNKANVLLTKSQTAVNAEQAQYLRQQQDESYARTMLINAQKLNTEADTVLKNKDADIYEKRWAMMIKKMNSEITLNYMSAANQQAQEWRNYNAALGYSESTSESKEGGGSTPAIFHNLLGSGSIHRSTSKSHSKSW